MARMTDLFKDRQPLIAMAHLLPLPGTPLYDAAGQAGRSSTSCASTSTSSSTPEFDSVLFCNEGDRPYSFNAGYDGVAAMTRVVTELAPKDRPFGVDYLWDSLAALNVAMATGASSSAGSWSAPTSRTWACGAPTWRACCVSGGASEPTTWPCS